MIVWETIRFLLLDFLLSLVTFPIWWYTTGAMKVIRLILREGQGIIDSLNLRILFRYLFKPMFGQADITGRIISFFVRIVDFFVRFCFAIIYAALLLLLLLSWLLLPLFIFLNILYHLGLPLI